MISVVRKHFLGNLKKIRILSSVGKSDQSDQKRFLSVSKMCKSTVVAEKRKEMISYYPEIEKQMKEIVKFYDPIGEGKHLERVLQYNLAFGKNNRGQIVVNAFEEIASDVQLTEENLRFANYLGWCMEMFHRFYLILDDITDGSTLRRGQLCWYKVEDVQMKAINDSILMKEVIYEFLKQNLSHLPCYIELIEAMNTKMLYTFIGQNRDSKTIYQDFSTFSMEQFKKTAAAKTGHYSIYTPIQLGMILAGKGDDIAQPSARNILYEIGFLLQVQDDFIDCFGDPKVTGKNGTDIEDGKCTWLAATFLNLASAAQKATFKEFYGKADKEAIQRIKKLYEEVGLEEAYKKFEDEAYVVIKSEIDRTKGIPVNLCFKLMDKFYKRTY